MEAFLHTFHAPTLPRVVMAPTRAAREDLAALPEGRPFPVRFPRAGRIGLAAHRALDIAVAAALLLLTAPLLLLTALAIRLESPGTILYRQERVGLNGKVFSLYKFRSMRADAEADGAPVWAQRRDPRVTRVGRVIRLLRIDEIPQIVNVFLGQMAMVGPRPERPEWVAALRREIPRFDDRTLVKPGITGWAQVNYRYGASIEDSREKLAYDLFYVRNRSLALDLLVLAATVRVVLFGQGAR
jgi:lipopolysaccharide/colanic/teichoic acid biosynthesis glycosyltransferase